MTVRPIRAEEVSALSRVTVDAYTALGLGLPDDYVAELADVAGRVDEAVVLVAVDDVGEVVGGITYVDRPGRWTTFDDPDQAELRMLAVSGAAERRGVGTALVEACIERARAEGRRMVTLHTTAPMRTAQRLYERLGFRHQPERDVVLDDGMVLLGYFIDVDG